MYGQDVYSQIYHTALKLAEQSCRLSGTQYCSATYRVAAQTVLCELHPSFSRKVIAPIHYNNIDEKRPLDVVFSLSIFGSRRRQGEMLLTLRDDTGGIEHYIISNTVTVFEKPYRQSLLIVGNALFIIFGEPFGADQYMKFFVDQGEPT